MNVTSFSQAEAIPQDSTRIYSAVLRDQNGTPLDPSAVSSILATLTDVATGTEIVPSTEVKNVNGGTLGAAGAFSFSWGPGLTFTTDMVSTDATLQFEQHQMCFDVTHTGGKERHEVYFYIERMSCAA